MAEFIGFHGTNAAFAEDILTKGFMTSQGDDHWLGDGIYFFVEGISKYPEKQAEDWIIAQAWDNTKKANAFSTYSILQTQIRVSEEKLLDLTSSDGVEVFNYLRDLLIFTLRRTVTHRYMDGEVINYAMKKGFLNVDVVKGNFYIKFALERRLQINMRTPNCTICAVLSNTNLVGTIKKKEDEIN